jgi:hypothetical protein
MAEGEAVSAVAGSTTAIEQSTPAIAEPNNAREGGLPIGAGARASLAHP